MLSDSEFIENVIYFHFEKDNVTRYMGWDEERCKALMPAFYHAWKAREVASDILDRVARSYGDSMLSEEQLRMACQEVGIGYNLTDLLARNLREKLCMQAEPFGWLYKFDEQSDVAWTFSKEKLKPAKGAMERAVYTYPSLPAAQGLSDVPLGAIENGRTLADRLEAYPFNSQGGDLRLCSDWQEFRRCFEHLAQWAMQGAATVAEPSVLDGWKFAKREDGVWVVSIPNDRSRAPWIAHPGTPAHALITALKGGVPECDGSHDYGEIRDGAKECSACTGQSGGDGAVQLIWDIFDQQDRWFMQVTSPIGWDAKSVSDYLTARRYVIGNAVLNHRHTYDSLPPSMHLKMSSSASYFAGRSEPSADERAAFEAWARNEFGLRADGLTRRGEEYKYSAICDAWAAWKARAAQSGQRAGVADCPWAYDEQSFKYDSACGEAWCFIDGGPEDNNVRFCQGCGGRVVLAAPTQQQERSE